MSNEKPEHDTPGYARSVGPDWIGPDWCFVSPFLLVAVMSDEMWWVILCHTMSYSYTVQLVLEVQYLSSAKAHPSSHREHHPVQGGKVRVTERIEFCLNLADTLSTLRPLLEKPFLTLLKYSEILQRAGASGNAKGRCPSPPLCFCVFLGVGGEARLHGSDWESFPQQKLSPGHLSKETHIWFFIFSSWAGPWCSSQPVVGLDLPGCYVFWPNKTSSWAKSALENSKMDGGWQAWEAFWGKHFRLCKKKLLVLMVMVSKLFWHWQGVAMEDPKRSKEDHMMMYRVII